LLSAARAALRQIVTLTGEFMEEFTSNALAALLAWL
jgi:hypothetical protein